jgi:hypothetical protein
MKPGKRHAPFRADLVRPVVFNVGEHALRIVNAANGRWTVSVDGGPASGTFGTQVEAWEAGVREADTQDRQHRT